ncbi:MAG: DNA-3-methyladenine glycosylase I [Thaumarchaeota archaeon]|nr:DNA-3-methyladenine glycosylase I [Nitrososphaerota archaeon]
MPPASNVAPPKDDADYFGRMTRAIFAAGLNWKMIENKWPRFTEAFGAFSPSKVASMTERDIARLMKDEGIVRNEKKIRATLHNAGEFVRVGKEFGSFKEYLQSFGRDEQKLQEDIQERFHHLGPSSARMFLWLVGHKLTPNAEEKAWMAGHH